MLCHAIPSSDTGVLTYDDPDGLSRTAILTLAQDARGYLWIGTQRGPVRFDGREWCTPAGLAALRTFDTWAFDTAEPDASWVGTNGAGLWLVDTRPVPSRHVTTLTQADGLADDDVHILCRDLADRLWVGTHHGLAVVDGQRVTACWSSRDGIPEAGICALCADPVGGMWAGSLHGLLRIERGTLQTTLTRRDGLPSEAVYALCADPEGRVWAGTRDGIAILRDGRVETVLRDGLPSPEIRALCVDRQGRVWAGTARGLVRIERDQVRDCWTRKEHLPSSAVWALLCDREGRLWVGTEGGLALLPHQSMPAQTVSLGPDAEGGAHAFATDQEGRTWIGTAGGLVTVASDSRTSATPPALPPLLAHAEVWAVQRDSGGQVWAGGRYGGIYGLDPRTGEPRVHVDAVNAVRCLVVDGERRLWLGTMGLGLACVDADRGALLHRVTAAQGLPSDHVSSLCLDGCGRLWVGMLGGGLARVNRHRGTVAAVLGEAQGLPRHAVSGIALGPDGQLWCTTQGGGLFRVDPACDRACGVWTVDDGLPSDTLFSCAFDTQGTLWLGTAHGLARFHPVAGACLTLGRAHGLPGEMCEQGALHLDERGRLWIGTTDGVAVIAPGDVPCAVPPCAVFLTGMRIMGQERDLVDGLEIDDSNYDLEIDYGAVMFTAAAQVLYRTQLVGLDGDWSQPHSHRFVRYTNLRPGEYTFRVAARNWGGQWSVPAEWSFRMVRDPAAEDLERTRHRAEVAEVARATAEAAVSMRNEVLRTVAHDLRSPLTSILGRADLLQMRLERGVPPLDWLRTQATALHDAAVRMDDMVEEIMDVVRLDMGQPLALRVGPVDVGALVQGVVRTLVTGSTREASLAIDAPPDLVVEGDRARLERVVQNLIGNALKYSPVESPIEVQVRAGEQEVTIHVRDHGVGIPADELSRLFTPYYRASTSRGIPGTGLGLAGAKSIVEQHGGQIGIDSRMGEGTTATVVLPRRAPER